MKRFLTLLLTLALALSLPPAPARAADAVAFTDPALEALVRKALQKPQGDITAEEAAALDWLDLQNAPDAPDGEKIRDLTSLKAFTGLVGLGLDNNAIDDVTPLAALPKLRELSLLGNPLAGYEALGQLTGLEVLNFELRMRPLPFLAQLPKLRTLRIDGCRELPAELPALTQLQEFVSRGGELSDISLLAQLPLLNTIDLSYNLITDVSPLKDLPLTVLMLQGNSIRDCSPLKALYPRLTGVDFPYIEFHEPADPTAAVSFPDTVLEAKVRAALQIPEAPLTAANLAELTQLDLHLDWQPQMDESTQVHSLEGLQACLNLRELRIGFNEISDLTPLASLSELRTLDAGGNQISDLRPLSGLTQLAQLTLYGNPVQGIDALQGLTQMTDLHLGGVTLVDLTPLQGMTMLRCLYLPSCTLDDLSALSGLNSLNILELKDNFITDLSPLAGLTHLEILRLSNNPITDYTPIRDLYPTLRETDFELGQVFDVQPLRKPDAPDAAADLNDPELESVLRRTLGIQDRPLTQRDLCHVLTLFISGDMGAKITDLSALRYCKNLGKFGIDHAAVSDLSPFADLTWLAGLQITFCRVTDLTPLAGLTQLTMLELRGNQITDVAPLAALSNLKLLDVSDNQITDLSPLSGLTRLGVLRVSRNATADASSLAPLAANLQEKDFDPMQPLEQAGQQGGDANQQNTPEGGQPEAQATLLQPKKPDKVVRIPDAVLEAKLRETLGKPEGDLTQGDLAQLRALYVGLEWQETYPEGTQVQKLDGLEYCLNLQELDISWNLIQDVRSLKNLTQLTTLRAYGNQIRDLKPLTKLTALQNLNLGSNRVTDVKALQSLTELTELYLDHNRITNVKPLRGLTKLTLLNLDGNPIKSFAPLKDLYPQLKETDFTLP